MTFVGGITPEHSVGHALLERLAERVPLTSGAMAGLAGERFSAEGRHCGEAWGMDMYRVLARSQIVVNRHIRSAQGCSNNMRMFEAPGVGALLITERSRNLSALFEPGRRCSAYGGAEELIDLIEHHLADPGERVRIAGCGTAPDARRAQLSTPDRRLAELLEYRLTAKR